MSDRHMYQVQIQHKNDIFERWGTSYTSSWFHCGGDADHEKLTELGKKSMTELREDYPENSWNIRLVMRRQQIGEQIYTLE